MDSWTVSLFVCPSFTHLALQEQTQPIWRLRLASAHGEFTKRRIREVVWSLTDKPSVIRTLDALKMLIPSVTGIDQRMFMFPLPAMPSSEEDGFVRPKARVLLRTCPAALFLTPGIPSIHYRSKLSLAVEFERLNSGRLESLQRWVISWTIDQEEM